MTQPILIATIMRPQGDTGVQTHFQAYIEYLYQTKQPCELITPYNEPLWQVYPIFALRKLLRGEVSVWWYRYWHAYFLRLALKYRLKSNTECVIYAQCPLSAAAALRARVSPKQRVVMVTHFNVSQADEWAGKGLIVNGGKFYRSIQRFEAVVLPKLDGLVFVSKFMQKELIKRIPALVDVASAVVPNFLPDPGIPEPQQPIADLISIGTLEARKNQQYLLEIIAALRASGNALTLTIIGDGPDRLLLENKARALKIDDLVHFAGFVSNAAEQIALHKACIHVATIENLPVTLLEALARGRPVFAAPVGGVPEVLGDGAVGLALPLNDAHAAARIIAAAMSNQQWLATAGIAARERFLKNYTSAVAAKKLTGFLKAL
ncbi:glycosyltransferase family 4 protein [Methylobacter sp. S3L5C]|uniref:glycosyltransferase family 4 protein n=1 Tax=Methylobacter sp. S3L5C TaxID=2839024 RepID=UPI001FAB44C3|nr:glycosyltransferase family 4 protein [Methylobacter sp. S3L5C]UOA08556.1 glycosyltransferase family 4 protein [Methylobacter sp. S3L5C]